MSDSIFGLSEKALHVCEDRAVLITGNIVNASTPHYKARDLDFHKAMQQVDASTNSGLMQTSQQHIAGTNAQSSAPVLYRTPVQKSLDGNTVDPELERKNFLENALNYQVNLSFVQQKSDELMKAIKGA